MKAQNWTLSLNIIFSEILLKIQILTLDGTLILRASKRHNSASTAKASFMIGMLIPGQNYQKTAQLGNLPLLFL